MATNHCFRRLIRSGLLPAAENMAVDEAIFEAVAAGDAPPTLRIYGWQPPGVSLGCFQAVDERVNLPAIAARGYGLVRRPTGGRAIIHHHEVTYSVCIRAAALQGGGSVLRSYRELSRGIEAGLALLGLPACIAPRDGKRPPKPAGLPAVCFAGALGGDMTVDGRKIVGSAQMRRAGAILQHGSIPLCIDLQEHAEILGGPDGADASVLRHAALGVADALGREVTFDELAAALEAGFADAFGVELVPADLSPGERARAEQLVADKYANDEWNLTPGRRETEASAGSGAPGKAG